MFEKATTLLERETSGRSFATLVTRHLPSQTLWAYGQEQDCGHLTQESHSVDLEADYLDPLQAVSSNLEHAATPQTPTALRQYTLYILKRLDITSRTEVK